MYIPTTRKLLIILSLLGLIAAWGSASANQQSLLLSKAYWQDDSGQATYQDAITAEFHPFTGPLAKGYSSSAIWLKLRITGQKSAEPIALIVRPAFLSNVVLYDSVSAPDGQPPQPILSGRNAVIESNNHIGIDNGFVLQPSPVDRDVFLRVTTTTALTVEVSASRFSEAERDGYSYAWTLAVYLAFLMSFSLWALVSWLIRGESIYGLFAFRQFYSALHIFIWFGLLKFFFADDLTPAIRDYIYCFVTISILPVSGLFDSRLLDEFGASNFLRKLFLVLLAAAFASSFALLFLDPQKALQANAAFVAILVPLILLLALTVNDKQKKPNGGIAIWVIRGGYALITLVVLVPTLMYKNVIQVSMPVLNVLFAHAIISTIVLFSILTIRGRQRDLMAQDALVQYELKARELERESKRRLEKERFLSMLTHELRNPLTVIRLKTSRGSRDQAVHRAALDIEKVIERVEQSQKLDDENTYLTKANVELTSLVEHIVQEHSASQRIEVRAEEQLKITTDESILASMLRNLLDNAEKYSPPHSMVWIDISSAVHDGTIGVKIAVTNEVGKAGFPDSEKLFEKYYRAPGAHSQTGSGLGLFLVAGWAKVLGGTIRYDHPCNSDNPNSVCFSLWLPA